MITLFSEFNDDLGQGRLVWFVEVLGGDIQICWLSDPRQDRRETAWIYKAGARIPKISMGRVDQDVKGAIREGTEPGRIGAMPSAGEQRAGLVKPEVSPRIWLLGGNW